VPTPSPAEESLPGKRMKGLQIEEREKVNGLKLLIERGWTTNFRTKCQVSTQKLGNDYRLRSELGQRTIVTRERQCAPLRFNEMSAAQIGIGGSAYRRVL